MFVKIPFERLSVLCQNLATCLSAGLGVPASLRASVRSSGDRLLQGIVETAAERTESGEGLSEALAPNKNRFPSFFLPVIQCGERSGRLDEALQYLAQHCRLMVRPSRLVRNLWLLPLVIVAFGSLFRIALVGIFKPMTVTLAYTGQELMRYAVAAAVVGIVLFTPQLRALFDRLKLALPVVRPTEADLTVNRFFHALNLVYSTGGMRVEAMIRLAARSVGNRVIRNDLLRAANVIEGGGTVSEAFRSSEFILEEYKQTIRAGEEAGRFEHAFSTVARLTEQAMEHRLDLFNKVFQRVVGYAVVGSIVGTAFWIINTR